MRGVVMERLRALRRDCQGSESIEFLISTGALILIFVTLLMTFTYISTYQTATYVCRRVVRAIETSGEYDEAAIHEFTDRLHGSALDGMTITVDASYVSGRHIQLKDEFVVALNASYTIPILQLGAEPIEVELPIHIKMTGMSEVYWK